MSRIISAGEVTGLSGFSVAMAEGEKKTARIATHFQIRKIAAIVFTRLQNLGAFRDSSRSLIVRHSAKPTPL
jgi:hypothetical protein